jgi:CHAT domain-containing protein
VLQVDDGSTSVLMELMYQHLMDGRTTVAQALRLAMLHLLRQPSPHWRRPKYWACFLVVGATTRLRCTTSVEEWTVEDVCRFVQG